MAPTALFSRLLKESWVSAVSPSDVPNLQVNRLALDFDLLGLSLGSDGWVGHFKLVVEAAKARGKGGLAHALLAHNHYFPFLVHFS
eukprot:CAMPEP_0168332392 /NCGR_PEP_ID=MMETSP0213-20121227/8930_1 /TAXON_ID=151035 /ORGANISM="Euplotes harpa, Strain FSP1.4" /LENGTH=85 /DNA_ID=CAMNT_0008336407 /DNA_START=490 /DNA_END=743 /DNA_ORIENTATION=+